jgi:hypothetical protein
MVIDGDSSVRHQVFPVFWSQIIQVRQGNIILLFFFVFLLFGFFFCLCCSPRLCLFICRLCGCLLRSLDLLFELDF